MRISALLFSLFLCLVAASHVQAQNPGAKQDAEDARERLLRAEDQLDNIQANSEATKTSVDNVKSSIAALQQSVTKLESDNTALRQQIAEEQTALDQYKDEQLKSRQKLIDDVAGMIAADKAAPKSTRKKKDDDTADTPSTSHAKESSSIASNLTPPADTAPSSAGATPVHDDTPPPSSKPQKGYYHVVAFGETLTMIVAAYKDNGVHTSVSEIRKANGLSKDTSLKAGQKLFIPKPGT